MTLAVQRVGADMVLVDGNQTIKVAIPQETIIGGDATIVQISAGSILAKVHRDKLMAILDRKYDMPSRRTRAMQRRSTTQLSWRPPVPDSPQNFRLCSRISGTQCAFGRDSLNLSKSSAKHSEKIRLLFTQLISMRDFVISHFDDRPAAGSRLCFSVRVSARRAEKLTPRK